MVLSIQEHCERIVCGPRLADKLAPFPDTAADVPRPAPAIDAPARAPGLEFGRRSGEGITAGQGLHGPAPDLRGDDTRLALLHAFANHELLAIELMAKAVLDYGEAPPAFRRGLVQTIGEEQRHLGLYLQRMESLGGVLGGAPLSGFFWRTFQGVRTPLEFVTAMGLTFEQANLDYAHHYRRRFAAEGDTATARLLDEVFEDEIRHVKFAWVWFSRWRDPARSPLRSHERNLVMPLTIDRARGLEPELGHRTRAGLPEGYARQVLDATAAKGRAPTVWLFNPNCEDEIDYGVHRRPPAARERSARDWACALTVLAGPGDIVVCDEPSEAFVDRLRGSGLAVPRFLSTQGLESSRVPTLLDVRPWGASPRAERLLGPLRERIGRGLARDAPFGDDQRRLFRKDEVAQWSPGVQSELVADGRNDGRIDGPELGPRVVHCEQTLLDALAHWRGMGFDHAAVKEPFGAAGRGVMRVEGCEMTEPQAGRARRVLARTGALLVEPWLERCADLSLVCAVRDGKGVLVDVVQSEIDGRGQYRGSVVERPLRIGADLSTELRRFVHADGRDPDWLWRTARTLAERVGPRLAAAGLHGPFGIDAFIHRRGGRLSLRPFVELNPRLTMGHLAHQCAKLLAPDRTGRLRVMPAQAMLDGPPPRLGERGLEEGLVWLTDPVGAKTGLALAVGDARHSLSANSAS